MPPYSYSTNSTVFQGFMVELGISDHLCKSTHFSSDSSYDNFTAKDFQSLINLEYTAKDESDSLSEDEWKSEYSSYVSPSLSSEDDENYFEFLNCKHRCSDLIFLQKQLSYNFDTFSHYMLSRETIWMFMGVDELFFYILTKNGYFPSNTIPYPLYSLLENLCHTSNKLRRMRSFCHTVMDTSLSEMNNSNLSVTPTDYTKIHTYSTLTFQAFSSAISTFLYDINSKLLGLERIQHFLESYSLLPLYNDLEILSEEVSYIYSIFLRCLSPPNSVGIIPIYEVKWLLDCLWQELSLCELQLMVIPKYSRIPISVLLISLAPLFNFISQWFYSGFITDKYHEFFIEQLHFPASCDHLSVFWKDGCKIRCNDNMIAVPSIFSCLAHKILSSGKSLGSLALLGEKIAEEPYGLLYFTFINNLLSFNEDTLLTLSGEVLHHCHKFRFVSSKYDEDPFLFGCIIHLTDSIANSHSVSDNVLYHRNIWHFFKNSRTDISTSPIFISVELVLNSMFLPIFSRSSTKLIRHLSSHCNVYLELSFLYKIYLFGDCLTMQKFSEMLFESKERFSDSLSITSTLLQAIYFYHPNLHLDERLFITIGHSGTLSDIRLHYIVDSLASIVITPSNLLKYQDMFSFLLNLKWIEFLLHRRYLLFNRHSGIQFLPIFIVYQMKFYFSIISQFFFNHVILVHFREFSSKFNDCNIDTDFLLNEHQKFITSIHLRCFLDDSHREFGGIFKQLFDLIILFCNDGFVNLETFYYSKIQHDLNFIIKRIFTILRIPATKHKFDFLVHSIDYNNYISHNVL